jgi:hypothetical protein
MGGTTHQSSNGMKNYLIVEKLGSVGGTTNNINTSSSTQ